MNNLIIKDEYIIGCIEDIENNFRKEIKNISSNYDYDFEEIKYAINNLIDVILVIQENEQDNINNNCLFKIEPLPMGGYTYKVLKEV